MSDKTQYFLEEGAPMRFVAMSSVAGSQLEVVFGGQHAQRATEMVDVDEFIGIKSHRAKGKRITTYDVASLRFIEPEVVEEEDEPMDEDMGDDEAIDMDDIVGEDISADPNVDYNELAEEVDILGASQLNLF
jgi:topoisomerase-4 subunit A